MNFRSSCPGNAAMPRRSDRSDSAAALTSPLLVCWLMAASLMVSPQLAAETPLLVKAMLDSAPAAVEEHCSYTRTLLEGERSKRERYHAGRSGTRWELDSVDGREPTAAELQRYARRADDRVRRHPLALDLRGMVDPDHWRLRSETTSEAVFEFHLRPDGDLDPRLIDKVVGTLVVDKVRRQPVLVRIENTRPAYVAPLVRVAEYVQEMHFLWDDSVGTSVLTRTETRLRGRAVGVKVLRQHKLVHYSDYQCRADVAQAAE
jgi:hypothetical protein